MCSANGDDYSAKYNAPTPGHSAIGQPRARKDMGNTLSPITRGQAHEIRCT